MRAKAGHDGKKDLTEALAKVKASVQELAEGLLPEGAVGPADTLSQVFADGVEKGRSVSQAVGEQIEEHPGVSLLTAFGLGFAIGNFLKSRK
jgi:hypothetical protein